MFESWRLLCTLMHRDVLVYRSRFIPFIIQYSVIYPLLYGICFGYLMPKVGMGPTATMASSVILVGTICAALPAVGFAFLAEFIFDFERNRLLEFCITRISPRLYVLQKIVTGGLFTFLCLFPYYVVMKVMFWNFFDLSQASFGAAVLVLLLASLYQAALLVLFASYSKSATTIRYFWRRMNYPMMMLGGFLTPWFVMNKFSQTLGYLVLANPVLAVTEGLRRALLGGDQFLALWQAVGVLVVVIGGCTVLALRFFQHKTDHI